MTRFLPFRSLSAFVVLFTLFSHAVQAQATYIVTGKVLNAQSQPVDGATVSAGTSASSANGEGFFTLRVTSNKITLTVSAVGYTTKQVTDITLQPGIENMVDVILELKKSELGDVVVTSTRRQNSTQTLLTMQRNNTSLSSGLAADFIRRTPDKNTGEVLRRVSGASIQDNKFVIVRGLSDRYNNAMINGALLPSTEPDKKAFSFDIIPSQLIDNLIINKTATPDLTGEFAGGLVQITTRDIPTRNSINFGISYGFNTQSIGKDFVSNPRNSRDWLGFDDGTRSLPAAYPQKYRAYNRLSEEERIAVSKAFNGDVYREETSTALPIQQYNLSWSNAERFKNGAALGSVLGVTYRQSKLIYPNVVRSIFDFDNTALLDYTDAQNRYAVNWGALANVAYSKGGTKVAFKNLFNQLFEDNYYQRTGFNNDNLQDVRLRSSVLNQRSMYSGQLELSQRIGKEAKLIANGNYSLNSKQQPDLRVTTFARSAGTSDAYSINNRGNNTNRFWSDLTDQALGGTLKLELPFKISNVRQQLTVGGGTLARVREFQATILALSDPANRDLTLLPYDQIFAPANFSTNGFEYITDLQNVNDRYVGVSALSNAFLMMENRIADRWKLIWGVRAEYFEQLVETRQSKDIEVLTDKLDFLPSLNVNFSPNTRQNIRFAVSRTVARPEFREVAPFAFFDFEEIASTVGNPQLQRSSIWNADLRYELYPKRDEALTFGAFAKRFTDPIELRLNSASAPTRRQYEFQNATSAVLYGVEAEFRKSLGFLGKEGGFAENLYFNGNLSLLFSEVKLPLSNASGEQKGSFTRPLQGQSPYLVNAGFQYDGEKGLGFSVLYNTIGQRLRFVGNQNFGDIYEKPRNLLDLQVSKKLFANKGEIRLTVSDLLNAAYVLYEKPVTKTETKYKEGVDRIYTSYKPGTTFTLGFTYDINLK